MKKILFLVLCISWIRIESNPQITEQKDEDQTQAVYDYLFCEQIDEKRNKTYVLRNPLFKNVLPIIGNHIRNPQNKPTVHSTMRTLLLNEIREINASHEKESKNLLPYDSPTRNKRTTTRPESKAKFMTYLDEIIDFSPCVSA